MKRSAAIASMVLLLGCTHGTEVPEELPNVPFALELPPGFPYPNAPLSNPLTDASVRLGKALFFEKALSRDNSVSCASCHFPDVAFCDTSALSTGVEGATGLRNSPTLGNIAYHGSFFRDGGVPTLERQVLAPVHDPLEMDHDITLAAERLHVVEPYRTLSMKAYARTLDPYVITRAIASYERTLISGWSRYDRYMQGQTEALTEAEIRGLDLFNSERLNCTACHTGFDLSDHGFHNVGQYLAYADSGRARITLAPGDNGKFKTPTLRNVALTGPYMHDGSLTSLSQVIDLFASGGLPHPNRDPEMQSFVLSQQEKNDLIAFLSALTDERTLDQVR